MTAYLAVNACLAAFWAVFRVFFGSVTTFRFGLRAARRAYLLALVLPLVATLWPAGERFEPPMRVLREARHRVEEAEFAAYAAADRALPALKSGGRAARGFPPLGRLAVAL